MLYTTSSRCLLSCFAVVLLAPCTRASTCDCYTTDGNRFLEYKFWDFRSLSSSSDDFTQPPPTVTESQNNGSEPVTSEYFNSTTFNNDWAIQTWIQNSSVDFPIEMVNSAQNVYISQDTGDEATYLTLRTTRLPTFQSVGEIDTNLTTIFHASIRIRARVSGAAGAVAGLFTYADDTNEADIEILTRDPDTDFRATNQPDVDPEGNEIPGASYIVDVPTSTGTNSSYSAWNDWRIDWLPDRTEWFVNGLSMLNNSLNVPKLGSHFILNMWGNGGVWSGNMTIGDSATVDVQYVEMLFNTTDPAGDNNCNTLCTTDGGSTTPGNPVAASVARTYKGAQRFPLFVVWLIWSALL